MKQHKQEVIGSFTVVDSNQDIKEVIVGQDIITHYSGTTSHSKSLFLDIIDGPKLYKTDDPNIFQLPDGSTLRKKVR